MRHWKEIIGSALALMAMAAVLYWYGGDLRKADVANPVVVRGLLAATASYVTVMVMAAFGWRLLLSCFGQSVSPHLAERDFLISQIGKYAPGNVAQYVGRIAMAVKGGIAPQTASLALLTETISIMTGGLIASAVAVVLAPNLLADVWVLLPTPTPLGWVLLAALGLVALLVVIAAISRLGTHLKALRTVKLRCLSYATMLYTVAFILLGLSLHFIVAAIAAHEVTVSLSIALFAAAWVGGLVTPGAPGGIGVRESIITVGLSPFIGGTAALTAALLHRAISVLGDVISFGIGLAFARQASKGQNIYETGEE